MHEYVFKMKKGDIEIELKSDDLEFVEEQLNKLINEDGEPTTRFERILNVYDEYVLDDPKIFEEIVKVYDDMFTTPSFYINNEFNENMINKELSKTQYQEQKSLKNYVVYVSTKIKEKYINENFNVDLNEQNNIMNKFLIQKSSKEKGSNFTSFFNAKINN